MTQIRCENLYLDYDNRRVINDLSFSVSKGDFLSIVGENGSGKSTLVKAISGLKKPSSGRIVFCNGQKGRIGYLPQQYETRRDFPAGVYEIILSGTLGKGKFLPFYSKQDKTLADEMMKKLDISDLKRRAFSELSGGQQQRVLLCRALCAADEIILLDEPSAGLDPVAVNEMYELLKLLNNEGITVIMVSHDIECAVRYSSKILHLCADSALFVNTADYLRTDIGRRFAQGI